jgi:hypothetical protein
MRMLICVIVLRSDRGDVTGERLGKSTVTDPIQEPRDWFTDILNEMPVFDEVPKPEEVPLTPGPVQLSPEWWAMMEEALGSWSESGETIGSGVVQDPMEEIDSEDPPPPPPNMDAEYKESLAAAILVMAENNDDDDDDDDDVMTGDEDEKDDDSDDGDDGETPSTPTATTPRAKGSGPTTPRTPRAKGSGPTTPKTPGAKARGPKTSKPFYPTHVSYDPAQFDSVEVGTEFTPAKISSIHLKCIVTVPQKRLKNALKNLHFDSFTKMSNPKLVCNCDRKCEQQFGTQDILDSRKYYLQFATQEACNLFLIDELRSHAHLGSLNYYLKHTAKPDQRVCSTFYFSAYGFSNGKLQKCRERARGGKGKGSAVKQPHGNSGKTYATSRQVEVVCRSFWMYFYDLRCQKPNEELWLHPTNLSHHYVYENEFLPWCTKSMKMENPEQTVSRASFEKASKHGDFQHVKRRAKHRHLRCSDCSSLSARLTVACMRGEDVSPILAERNAHEEAVRDWRVFEECLVNGSRSSPSHKNVFRFDATTSAGFPHFTNRTIKGMSHHRFSLTPNLVMDEARQRLSYLYSVDGYAKGANRWCTELFNCIKALKESGSPASRARVLVLIGDNFSENKNNTDFEFCADLVARGWYDEVYMYFGPVGHTHNGVDSVHHVHNLFAMNYTLGTPADLANAFVTTWRENCRPEFVIIEQQFDWTKFYSPHKRQLKGFTKTVRDPLSVQAFRVQRSRSGVIEMHWKHHASERKAWLGMDSQQGSPGFRILRSKPTGMPTVIPPKPMPAAKVPKVFHPKIRAALLDEDLGEAWDWLKTVVTNRGMMTINQVVEKEVAGELGRLVTIGYPGHLADVRLISNHQVVTAEEFWSLPAVALKSEAHTDLVLPDFRYADRQVLISLHLSIYLYTYLY